MSICIVGQKFLSSDLELKDFITKDLSSFINNQYREYFLRKEVAATIANKIIMHYKNESDNLNSLLKILNSSDINLLQHQEIIQKNDSIKKNENRISILEKIATVIA